jgi:hypothetical protein
MLVLEALIVIFMYNCCIIELHEESLLSKTLSVSLCLCRSSLGLTCSRLMRKLLASCCGLLKALRFICRPFWKQNVSTVPQKAFNACGLLDNRHRRPELIILSTCYMYLLCWMVLVVRPLRWSDVSLQGFNFFFNKPPQIRPIEIVIQL